MDVEKAYKLEALQRQIGNSDEQRRFRDLLFRLSDGEPTQSGDYEASKAESEILLARNARVMLTVNLWVTTGLVNGAMGTVTDILFKEKLEQTALPTVVLVAFDNYNGLTLINLEGIPVVPIIPIRRIWDDKSGTCFRLQIPFSLAWAITAHKSQGLTLSKAAIDLGRKEFATGLSFVANSRFSFFTLSLTITEKKQLTEFERGIITGFYQSGDSERTISEKIGRSKTAIHKTISRYRETERHEPAEKTREIFVNSTGKEASLNIMRSTLYEMGYHSRVALRKPYISELNRRFRLKWSRERRLWTTNDWKKVIWNDESRFTLFQNDEEILGYHLIPFLEEFEEENGEYLFQQDNATIHTSIQTRNFIEENAITLLPWPGLKSYRALAVLKLFLRNFEVFNEKFHLYASYGVQ
ncbi:ATP-dependent DNA helicase Pif1-like [Rhizophagus clarus]|uniref:ATP-dependent DNA helicase Pif1-like n=1 Tax=Rhizophagus clarus TaxID=94130 RepID=A0A8H3MD73_9GLOM|nr:ATP-dependent DNA helicase Pif1-like [Rhizophagus clarus]